MNKKHVILTTVAISCAVMMSGALKAQNDDSVSAISVPRTSGAVAPVGADPYAAQSTATGAGFQKLPIRFGLSLAVLYDDNINISKTHRLSDGIEALTPSLTLETSRPEEAHPFYAGITYDPTISWYDSHSNNDNVDHHVKADEHYLWSGKLLTGVTQSYDTNNGPNVDVGGRVFAETYTTRVYAAAPLTGKINWDAEGIFTANDYSQGYDNDQWLFDTYFDYAVLPKLRVGVGGEFGFLDFTSGYHGPGGPLPNNTGQTFQQGNVRVIYAYSDKVSLTAKFGGEAREYGSGTDTATPVMDIGATWTPFVHTLVTFDAYRRTVAAISQNNTDYDYTGFDVTVRQGFERTFSAALTFAYNNANYNIIAPVNKYSGLTYNYVSVRPSVDWTPNQHFTSSIYYQYEKNIATNAGSGFEDNQVGISGSFAY